MQITNYKFTYNLLNKTLYIITDLSFAELSEEDRGILTGDIILPENNGKLAGAQFVAEPDDLKDLEESLPEMERGMIKEFNDPVKHLLSPHAFRYISDQQGLEDIEKTIKSSSSQRFPYVMRYTHEGDKVESINNQDLARQLNRIMHFQGSELNNIASQINSKHSDHDDEVKSKKPKINNFFPYYAFGKEQSSSGEKTKDGPTQIKLPSVQARPKHNKMDISADDTLKHSKNKKYFRKKGSAQSTLKNLQSSHNSENSRKLKDINKLDTLHMKNQKKYHNRTIKRKHLITRNIENLKVKPKLSTAQNNDNGKDQKRNGHYIKQTSSTNEIKRHTRESVKKAGVEEDGEDYEVKKRTSIFSDIAAAFQHIKEDEESMKGKTKKSSLITPNRKSDENTDKKPGKSYVPFLCICIVVTVLKTPLASYPGSHHRVSIAIIINAYFNVFNQNACGLCHLNNPLTR